jgi:ParB/RepB/Spo0J family partition protein
MCDGFLGDDQIYISKDRLANPDLLLYFSSMKIEVSKLKHHPKNKEIYTLSSIEELMDSISELGLLQPLVVDQQNQIISGNRRFESVKRLGWKKVQIERKNVKIEEEEILLVHYNKQRVKSFREFLNEYFILKKNYEVGQGKRTDLTSVRSNKSSTGRDRVSEEIGISSAQLGKLLFIHKHQPHHIELLDKGILTVNQSYLQVSREVKESQSRKKTNTTTSKCLPNTWRFYQKSSDNMSELKEEEIQTIFTSPPYWNKRLYSKEGGLGNEKSSLEFVENVSSHLDDCWRVLHDKGSFFLNLGDTFYNGNLQNIPHRVIIKLQERGWILRNTIIWSKTNPKPSSTKRNLTPSYEFIFHLTKSLEYDYVPTLNTLSTKTKPSLPPRHRSSNGNYSDIVSPYIPNQKGKNMGDYWNEDIVRSSVSNQKLNIQGEHPAPFPEQIVLLPILQTSKEGQIILDPFCGSGTVGRVCDKLKRSFVGYDTQKFI